MGKRIPYQTMMTNEMLLSIERKKTEYISNNIDSFETLHKTEINK